MNRRLSLVIVGLITLGLVASVTIAVASYHAGASVPLPHDGSRPGILGATRWVYLVALSVLVLSWLLLGRAIRVSWGDDGATHRQLWVIRAAAAAWATPVLAAAPTASRDVWAYAAQADLYRHGVDPYTHGPGAYAGRYLPYVGHEWLGSPSPYGPVWLGLMSLVIGAAGTHVLATVIVTRLLCALGLVLAIATIPRVANAFGGSPARALWLFAANPVLVVVALGGPHNDLLVGGLICLAFWLLVCGGSLWLTLLVPAGVLALATEVKLPAAAALAFLPWLWLRRTASRRPAWQVVALVVGTAVVVVAVTSLAAGLGLGWAHQVNANSSGAIAFSVPVLVSFVYTSISGPSAELSQAAQVHPHVATAASAVVALVLLGLWALAYRSSNPQRLLAIALAVGVIASTTIHPWYAGWALLVAALTVVSTRVTVALAAFSAWAALAVLPNGSSYLAKPPGLLIAALAVGVTVLALRTRPQRNQSRVRTTSRSPSA